MSWQGCPNVPRLNVPHACICTAVARMCGTHNRVTSGQSGGDIGVSNHASQAMLSLALMAGCLSRATSWACDGGPANVCRICCPWWDPIGDTGHVWMSPLHTGPAVGPCQFLTHWFLILQIYILSDSCEIGLRWVPQNPIDDYSTLVQAMAWCREAQQAITWTNVDLSLCCHMG